MEDKILVILNEDANHTFESEESVIGRVGEGGIAQFEITIPEKLTNGSLYLDFKKPNGEKIRTRRLDINGGKAVYDVEKYLLTDDGEIKVQAVFVTSNGKTWKSSNKKYNILKSVNAVHEIPDNDKDDFLTEAQKVVFGFDDRLKSIEQWMNSETYEEMTAKLSVNPSGSKEYGASVTGAVLTWDIDKEVSYVKLTLPNGTTVDKIIEADLTETPLSKLTSYTDKNTYIITASKTWTLNATRADGNKETKSPTATISRQYRVYWGLGTQADGFDSDFITGKVDSSGNVIKKGLRQQGTALTTSKGRTLTFSSADNQYVYYAIPTALGTPTFQIGDFPLLGGFEAGVKISVDTGFDDSNGNPIMLDYNLYRSTNLLTNNEAFKVHIT